MFVSVSKISQVASIEFNKSNSIPDNVVFNEQNKAAYINIYNYIYLFVNFVALLTHSAMTKRCEFADFCTDLFMTHCVGLFVINLPAIFISRQNLWTHNDAWTVRRVCVTEV